MPVKPYVTDWGQTMIFDYQSSLFELRRDMSVFALRASVYAFKASADKTTIETTGPEEMKLPAASCGVSKRNCTVALTRLRSIELQRGSPCLSSLLQAAGYSGEGEYKIQQANYEPGFDCLFSNSSKAFLTCGLKKTAKNGLYRRPF
jgi:hypothetical protein